jgi:hypothetical protein
MLPKCLCRRHKRHETSQCRATGKGRGESEAKRAKFENIVYSASIGGTMTMVRTPE